MLSSNSISSYQHAINEMKLNTKQSKKKIINISINKAPTPIFHQKSINLVENYQETSEKIKLKNYSKQNKIININLDDSKNSTSKALMNKLQNKWKGSLTTKNNPTIKIDYGNVNYLQADNEETTQHVTNLKKNNDTSSGIISSNLNNLNNQPVSKLNESNVNSTNMQITFSHRNYNNETLSCLHTNSNSNYLIINQTNTDDIGKVNLFDRENDKHKEKFQIENVKNIQKIKPLRNNNSICDINKLISNKNNAMNLNLKISSLLSQLNASKNSNTKKLSIPIHSSKVLNNVKENSIENKSILKNNFATKKLNIDINKCIEYKKENQFDSIKSSINLNAFNIPQPFPLSTKNDVSKILKNSSQFKNIFKDIKTTKIDTGMKHNSKSNSRCKYTLQNDQNESVDKLKTKFKFHIQNNKSLSIANVKQKYKELMKNKSIPSSLMIKSNKLSHENNQNLINSSTEESKFKENNLKEKIVNKLKIINNIRQTNSGENENKKKMEDDHKMSINLLKENIILDPISKLKEKDKQNLKSINDNIEIETKECDNFDDMNSIVKRIKFEEINVNKENIFSDNNFVYKSFEAKFYLEFDNFIYPNFEKNLNSSTNSSKKDNSHKELSAIHKSTSISTLDNSSNKKNFSPTIFGKVSVLKINLSKLK